MKKTVSRVSLTAGRVDAFKCAPDITQDFLWDTTVPTLALRASPTGRKTYVFESRLHGQTIRIPIGTAADWSIKKAQVEAQRLKVLVDDGKDPRELERNRLVEEAALAAAAIAKGVTVGDVWPLYMASGKPKRRTAWKPRYKQDIVKMAAAGGESKKRGKGLTRPGPIYPLLALPLIETKSQDVLKAWYDRESVAGEHQAARALMVFRGFLRWCAGRPEYRDLVDRDAGRAPAILENLPASTKRTDALEAAQLPGWWSGVEQLNNRAAGVYLRALLLTGARREEVAGLKWSDVDFVWRKLTLADKVDATRTIPLTPYLAWIIGDLPRSGEFVFASASKSGRIADARASHTKALRGAGIPSLTIHGLRRSFSLLGEAAGAPAGAIAQVMGHKPSATAEGYRPRTIDALRPYLEQIEAHILKQAGIVFDVEAATTGLHAVA